MTTTNDAAVLERARLRRTVLECSALVDLLDALYPPTAYPPPRATDREIAEWMAERRMVERLKQIRREALSAPAGDLPPVLRGA